MEIFSQFHNDLIIARNITCCAIYDHAITSVITDMSKSLVEMIQNPQILYPSVHILHGRESGYRSVIKR